MCFVGKPLVKAKSHLDLCTPLALRVPCLGQQKQPPARIQPPLVSPLDPIPEPPQREKLTRKGSTTTKKRDLPAPLAQRKPVPAACLPLQSLSAFCPAPRSCWQRGGRGRAQQKTANTNGAPKSTGCLPKTAARCLLFKLLNILY